MHTYAFGSICRGEMDAASDIDLLAVVSDVADLTDRYRYSVYTYERIVNLWSQGNPFAWHLFLESRLLYADNGVDHLRTLGPPATYSRSLEDCLKFRNLFTRACNAVRQSNGATVFELSTMFLAVRNIATCFSLREGSQPVFTRNAALQLGSDSLSIPADVYETLVAARLLSTRGIGVQPTENQILRAIAHADAILMWMGSLISRDGHHV
jgi:hypothetical protein